KMKGPAVMRSPQAPGSEKRRSAGVRRYDRAGHLLTLQALARAAGIGFAQAREAGAVERLPAGIDGVDQRLGGRKLGLDPVQHALRRGSLLEGAELHRPFARGLVGLLHLPRLR